MRLTLHTDLAFRALMFLALAGGRGSSIPEIAKAHTVSENHLRKVAGRLIEIGLVEATRGRGGGLRLALPPTKIYIGNTLRMLERDFSLVDCMGENPQQCVITGCCGLQRIFRESLKAWFQVLDTYTLADTIKGPRNLLQKLGIDQEDA